MERSLVAIIFGILISIIILIVGILLFIFAHKIAESANFENAEGAAILPMIEKLFKKNESFDDEENGKPGLWAYTWILRIGGIIAILMSLVMSFYILKDIIF
jgi:hypothetical protein